jgi:hypothetical protein
MADGRTILMATTATPSAFAHGLSRDRTTAQPSFDGSVTTYSGPTLCGSNGVAILPVRSFDPKVHMACPECQSATKALYA